MLCVQCVVGEKCVCEVSRVCIVRSLCLASGVSFLVDYSCYSGVMTEMLSKGIFTHAFLHLKLLPRSKIVHFKLI